MNKTNQKMSADDLEALLPWHAAGTLDSPRGGRGRGGAVPPTRSSPGVSPWCARR